jgi:tetratricopeptide (TPR) repeat protein
MWHALLVAALLNAEPALPPGHPPLGGAPALPPGHPATGEPAPTSALPAGHPTVSNPDAPAPSSDELLKKLDAQSDLRSKPKSFDVALSLGKLYYAKGRYEDAATFLREATLKGEPARVLARTLRSQKVSPGTCPPQADGTFELLAARASALAAEGKKADGLACAQKALGGPWVEGQRLLAQALFLLRLPKPALDALEALLDAVDDPESRYARAAVLLETQGDDPKALQRAKADFQAVARNPQAARAAQAQEMVARVDALISAGGVTAYGSRQKEKAKGAQPAVAAMPPRAGPFAGNAPGGPAGSNPPPLTQEMVDAVQNTERTPELEQGLSKLVEAAEEKLARGEFQAALDAYKRVVPFQPENGRARAGMAWSLVGLNRQPMAERIWSVAVSGDPSALDKLGDTLKSKGDAKGAKALWSKLAQAAPEYAQKAGLTNKLSQ